MKLLMVKEVPKLEVQTKEPKLRNPESGSTKNIYLEEVTPELSFAEKVRISSENGM